MNGSSQTRPEPEAIPAPKDVDFPGTIVLRVDASDVLRGIVQVHETIPVSAAGPLTLLYPKWLPGYHSPQAPIELLAGLVFTASGERIAWRRDPVEVYAFHLDVPDGTKAVDARFQFLSPTTPSQGRVLATADILNLLWNTVVLYPAGYFARRIEVEAHLTLPERWQFGCALEPEAHDGSSVRFKPETLDVLVDSPLFAGRHLRRIALDAEETVHLDIVADRPDLLAATAEQIAPHKALVAQADHLFGGRHFDHYDILLALTDELSNNGIEHHRSCEVISDADYFTNWEKSYTVRPVLAHEYVHSWNGKFRRGADSWIPSFQTPIRNSLMWVYEGQTQYWGHVLAARAGLWSLDHALQALALTAALYDTRPGRRWRPMSDTTRDPIIAGRSPLPWISWQRSEDYYSEGQLMWLDIDTRIRELSGDTRSLDDFARDFFGRDDGKLTTETYAFEDVIAALQRVAAFDWAGTITHRLETLEPHAPLGGLERGGYRLEYRDTPSDYMQALDASQDVLNLGFSIGLTVESDGTVQEVIWDSPAFDAALTAGATLLAVNGRAYQPDELKQAVTTAQDGTPIGLVVKKGKQVRTVALRYDGGHRYPHLVRIEGARPRLDEIHAART